MVEALVKRRRVLALAAGILLFAAGIVLLLYDPGGVTITWETASEVDTMGFNLYRADGSAEGPFEQVNDELIPAEGDPLTGANYEIEDKDVEPGRLYYYQIEEVEWSGTRQRYPEVAQARSGVPRLWLVAEGALLILLGCAIVYLQARQEPRSNPEAAKQYEQ